MAATAPTPDRSETPAAGPTLKRVDFRRPVTEGPVSFLRLGAFSPARGPDLRGVREAELTIRRGFGAFADFWRPFEEGNAVGVRLRESPADRQAMIREKVRDAYLSGEADGPRSFVATAWAVAGTW